MGVADWRGLPLSILVWLNVPASSLLIEHVIARCYNIEYKKILVHRMNVDEQCAQNSVNTSFMESVKAKSDGYV